MIKQQQRKNSRTKTGGKNENTNNKMVDLSPNINNDIKCKWSKYAN